VSLREENYPEAYVFFMRYCLLVIDSLRSHPEAKTAEAKTILKPLRDRIQNALDELERLKPMLDQPYNAWLESTRAQRERTMSRQRSASSASTRSTDKWQWSQFPHTKFLDVSENQELAVDLAKKEMHRRRWQAGLSAEEVSRRRAAGVWNVPSIRNMDDQELRRQMEATRRQLDRSDYAEDNSARERHAEAQSSKDYHYPSINKSVPLRFEPPKPFQSKDEIQRQPPRPPKEDLDWAWPAPTPPPAVPEKKQVGYEPPPDSSSIVEDVPPRPPKYAEDTAKQKRITFSAVAKLENGKPLRTIFLPSMLRTRFLELAAGHTRRGVEMCGLLCGTVINNALFITCLLIPEQKGTPDTCETENEAAMAEFCSTEDLIIIGWIHTHPTQTCFMSSRDLHTHASYQITMPESIAVVCAPRHQPSYVFSRTF